VILQPVARKDKKRIEFEILTNPTTSVTSTGTVKRGSATCPICGYTTPASCVRRQFAARDGGANDAQLIAVVTTNPSGTGRLYRKPTTGDLFVCQRAIAALRELEAGSDDPLLSLPREELPYLRSIFNVNLLGVDQWGKLFTARQALALLTFVKWIRELRHSASARDSDMQRAVSTVLALVVSKLADLCNSLCSWEPNVQCVQHLFGRQAMGIIWDFAEGNPLGEARGSFTTYLKGMVAILELYAGKWPSSSPVLCSATAHPLPDNAAAILVTDPPYYDLVPYADLSDFFYVWLKRMLKDYHPDLFREELTPKEQEIVQLAERNQKYAYKSRENYERLMTEALAECRRVVCPPGIGVVYFAHKGTDAWESQLQSIISAGWTVTASWPIETELATRLRGMNSAVLASTIMLVCRPRENPDGSIRTGHIGDWRDILTELPRRIHEWMPRLADEGIVGADAIFACLGPALEIFSRYSRVEKASGEAVTLREYLEQVWAAVAREALALIFTGADAAGFEEDARLTAMWLWTLHPGNGDSKATDDAGEEEEADEVESGAGKKKAVTGYALEYDAARKIAQGLGAHLEKLTGIVEVKGDTARLLSVSERTRHLFGKDQASAPAGTRKKKDKQMKLGFAVEAEATEAESGGWGDKSVSKAGNTVLDRLHQAMILFAAGRSEALRRFLVDDGAGRDQRFWKLADCLSKLYPTKSDEKRWVDGVLARKKGLGL